VRPVKAALIALVLTTVAPARVGVTILDCRLQVPTGWLILAAEILLTGATVWLAVRALRRFRSSPWMRPVLAGVP
jgi:hypothetical protein